MFLHTQQIPVKTYRSTDDGAPILSGQNLAQIFKACLAEGYGSQEGAGWTTVFEDGTAGKYVFAPPYNTPLKSFFVQVENQKNTAKIQIFKSMTAIDTGEKILELGMPFKYALRGFQPNWRLIASDRSLIFANQANYYGDPKYTGAFLYLGETAQASNGNSLIALSHTGGTYNDGDFSHGFFNYESSRMAGFKVFDPLSSQTVFASAFLSTFFTEPNLKERFLSPIFIKYNNDLYQIMGAYSQSKLDPIFTEFSVRENHFMLIPNGTNGENRLLAVKTDSWNW